MPDVAALEQWTCTQRFRLLLADDQAARPRRQRRSTLSPGRWAEEVEGGMEALFGQGVALEISVQQLSTLFTGKGSRG
jgi:hypothetical protein